MTDGLPREAHVRKRLNALLGEARWADALAFADAEPQLVGADASVAWSRGWALYKLNRLTEAKDQLEAAVRLEPDNAIRLWALGIVHREMGNHRLAEQSLLRSIELKDSAIARLNLATMYMLLGRLADAENVHREGVSLRPNHRERIEALADFLDDVGRGEEARDLRLRASALPSREERRRRSPGQV